jgi:hypothetical protein
MFPFAYHRVFHLSNLGHTMRKLLTLWIALAAIVGISASSFGGSMMLLGAGKAPGGGGGSAVLTFQGEQGYASTISAVASPNTFAAMPIGAAFSNRKVIAVITTGGSYNGAATAVTIGGVTATFVSTAGSGAGSFSGIITYAWADVPTGTTADVVLTGAASSGDSHIHCATYTFDKSLALNASPTTTINNTTGTTSHTTTINTGAGGFVIAALALEMLGSATSFSITSATESGLVSQVDATTSADHRMISSLKSGSAANTPTSVTWSWTTSGQSLGGLLAWN